MTVNYCPNCGKDLARIGNPSFCPGCGTEIGERETTEKTQSTGGDDESRSKKEKLRELANSDRPTAPVYEEMFKRRYEEEP